MKAGCWEIYPAGGPEHAARSARAVRERATPPKTSAQAPGRTVGEAATDPLRLAVGAAEAGLKVASRITGELIRRVPRL
jgi:hypothetical protein